MMTANNGKDYINRYAVLNVINDAIAHNALSYDGCVNEIMEFIAKIPAADVRPVVRGEWINDRNGKYSSSGDNFYCSICKDPSLRAFGKPAKTNYCPNCGADMRIFSTNCKNTVTTGEDREIFNLRAWLKNGKGWEEQS